MSICSGEQTFKTLISGQDYPSTWNQFLEWFHDEASCLEYFEKLRWSDEFICPRCNAVDDPLSMKAQYDPDDLMLRSFLIHVEDDRRRSHTLEGRVIGATPFAAWQNINCPVCLTEWTYRGRTFTGEVQTVMFSDFIREFSR